MQKASTKTTGRVIAGLAAACGLMGTSSILLTGAPSAQADPSYASQHLFVGVGSDALQNLFAAYTGASPSPGAGSSVYFTPLNSGNATGNYQIASFDAYPIGGTTLNPGAITTKLGGNAFDRPAGSGGGITALEDSITSTDFENGAPGATGSSDSVGDQPVTGDIDFARSARGPKSTGNGNLTFVPIARDGLGILYFEGSGSTDPAATSLTAVELASLYSGQQTTGNLSAAGVSPSYTYGAGELTFTSGPSDGLTLVAALPIPSAAPVTNLSSAIGDTSTQLTNSATYAGVTPSGVTQNSADAFYSGVSTIGANEEAVIPVSSGSVLGQLNGLGVDASKSAFTEGVGFASITDLQGNNIGLPFTQASESAPYFPSTTYYQDGGSGVTGFGYDTYVVVPTANLSSHGGSGPERALFSGSSSLICSPYAQSLANEFGFDSIQPSEEGSGGSDSCGYTGLVGQS